MDNPIQTTNNRREADADEATAKADADKATADSRDLSKARKMAGRIQKEETRTEAEDGSEREAGAPATTDSGGINCSSGMDKAKGYLSALGSKAKKSTSKAARRVQGRSAAHDANAAADKAERAMAQVSATIRGLTQTAVAATVGTAQGAISGLFNGQRRTFLAELHAADDLAYAGNWISFKTLNDKNGVPHDYLQYDIDEVVAESIGLDGKGTLCIDGAANTEMAIPEKGQTDVVVMPLHGSENGQLVGALVFTNDSDQEVWFSYDQNLFGESDE